MKSIGKYLALLMLVYFMVKCGVDTPEPEPEPEPEPIVFSGTAYALPTSIIAGETTTIYLKDLVNVTAVTINDTPISISEGSKNYTLTSTTTFTVKFTGEENKVIEKSLVVDVTEPPVVVPTKRDTLINLLCFGSFKKVKLERKVGDVWDELTMAEKETRRLLVFTKDGKVKDSDPLGIDLNFNGNYTITTSDNSAYLIRGGREHEIVTLDEKQLVLTYWGSVINLETGQVIEHGRQYKETYERI